MKKIEMDHSSINELLEKIRENLYSAKGIPEKIEYKVNPSVDLKKEEKVKIVFSEKAWKRMWALVDKATDEVGWYGTVMREDEKTFHIEDLLLCPQTVTGVTVTTDDLEFSNWSNGLDDDTFNHMRFYGHSHVRMGTTPSVTDENFYQNKLYNLQDFYIFGIFNKSNNYWFNIYDVENNVLYENKDIEVEYYMSEESAWAEEQIKDYVKKYAAPATNNFNKSAGVSNYSDIWKNWRGFYDEYE